MPTSAAGPCEQGDGGLPSAPPPVIVTLLFTDLVDSTQVVERLGDARAAALWAEHDRRARDLLSLHCGREVDRTDGFFLLFDDTADAVRFALAYHRAVAELALAARVGLHVGPITARVNDPTDVARGAKAIEVDGLAKPLAARVMALARGGQTLLSASARAALAASADAGLPEGGEIECHGHYRLKGIDAPAELFEFGAQGCAFTPPADCDKAYRVVRDDGLWRPVRAVRHNLPAERDAFVGRADVLRAMARALDAGTRLLSVVGPGGTGKTRLVGRYARGWLGDWPGGAYFCDLGEARSIEGIHFAVASALGVALGNGDASVQLGHAVAARGRCLVILDNFEQLLEYAQSTLGRWLDRATEAVFVVTSRERLHLHGEQVFAVEPLPLASEAIELFAVRAAAQRPDFALTDANRQAIARIVTLLDGLPLAIELAAARARVLSPVQIVERLGDRFALLTGARGAAARQATLKAAIDWSWHMLAPWEQAALAQCSVFDGGFTLEAAEAVLDLTRWDEAPPLVDAVQSLVDKSLLRAWIPVQQSRYDIDEPHFGMYLSIHDYAADKLHAEGAAVTRAVQTRHGLHYAGLGSDAAIDALSAHRGVERRQALLLELDNLMTACRRSIARADAPVAVATYRAIWEVLSLKGPFGPGNDLGERLLALPGLDAGGQADAAVCRADALGRAGRFVDASALAEQALAAARSMGDRRREGQALALLGQLERDQGRFDAARSHIEAALVIHREVGNLPGQASALHNLGNLHDQQGDAEASRACHEAALAICQQLGHLYGVGRVQASLAILDRHQGRMDEARAMYQAALASHREAGDRRSEGIALGNLANVLVDQGHLAQGQQMHEQALAIHREVGSRVVQPYALANIGLLHQQLGQLAQARACLAEALAIDREVANRFHEAMVLASLGALDVQEGRHVQGRAHLELALSTSRETGDRLTQGTTLAAIGDSLRSEQRLDEALDALTEAEALLRAIDNPVECAGVLRRKGQVVLALGNRAGAAALLAECEAVAARIGSTPDANLQRGIDELRTALG